MSLIEKYFDELWFPRQSTYTYKGQWVDTDKYDIVPKKEYREKLIEQKKQRVSELYKKVKELEDEIKELKT